MKSSSPLSAAAALASVVLCCSQQGVTAFVPVHPSSVDTHTHKRPTVPSTGTGTSTLLFATDGGKSDAEISSIGDATSRIDDAAEDMGKPLELESLQQSPTFLGLEPLEDGSDPFDNGLPIISSTIILIVSTVLTFAPFLLGPDPPAAPPGM